MESFRAEFADVKLLDAGGEEAFDFVVLAVPFDVLWRMLPQTSAAEPLRQTLARFETSPITGIHLWFDRQITDLDHAVLLDRTIQWMFHKSKLLERAADRPTAGRADAAPSNSYVELVVSSSKTLVEKSKAEIVELGAGGTWRIFSRRTHGEPGEVHSDQGSPCHLFAPTRN